MASTCFGGRTMAVTPFGRRGGVHGGVSILGVLMLSGEPY